jgi:hypothetical protein
MTDAAASRGRFANLCHPLRFALSQLEIVPRFSSTIKDREPLALRSSAALVSVQLAQFWQHPSDGFSRSVGSCDGIAAEAYRSQDSLVQDHWASVFVGGNG